MDDLPGQDSALAKTPPPGREMSAIRRRLYELDTHSRERVRKRLRGPVLSGAELIAEALQHCGFQRLSGMMGIPADAIFGGACKRGLRVLGFRSQVNAVLAAAADNYITGRMAHAVCLSAGPALTNVLTGVYYARDNHFPVLVLGTRKGLGGMGKGAFQELEAVPLFKSLTKWAASVNEVGAIMPMVAEASHRALEGQPGPVYLEFADELLKSTGTVQECRVPVRQPGRLPSAEVETAMQHIRQAERPLLCLGEDIRWEADLASLLDFVEREQLPFMTSPMGRGLLPEHHPLCANRARRLLPRLTDCFIMAGAWFDWRFRFGAELNPDAFVIHAHPDSEKAGANLKGAAQTSVADGGAFLNALGSAARGLPQAPDRGAWIVVMNSQLQEADRRLAGWRNLSGSPMQPREAYEAVSRVVPADTCFTVDGNRSLAQAQHSLTPARPLSWFDPGWNGLIGGSLGLAIGAQLAQPERPVLALASDTSFGFAGMELETCARLRIPVVCLVANNDGNCGNTRDRQWLPEGTEPVSCYTPGAAYHRIAEALGVAGRELSRPEKVAEAVQQAIELRQPACLNIRMDPHAPHPGFW